jgi:hypothetical protein
VPRETPSRSSAAAKDDSIVPNVPVGEGTDDITTAAENAANARPAKVAGTFRKRIRSQRAAR